jgi:hypothetical protein
MLPRESHFAHWYLETSLTKLFKVAAVFGTSLTQNIIVSRRSTAIIAAQMCKKIGINSITIDILEEIDSDHVTELDPKLGRQQTVQDPNSYPDLKPVLECLRIVDHRIYPAIRARLRNWYFFDGLGHEVMYTANYIMK